MSSYNANAHRTLIFVFWLYFPLYFKHWVTPAAVNLLLHFHDLHIYLWNLSVLHLSMWQHWQIWGNGTMMLVQNLENAEPHHYAESTGVDFTRTPIQRQTTELGNQQEIAQDNCSLISGPISSLIKLKSETRQTGTYSGFEDFLLTCHCNSKIRQKTLTSKCRKHLMSFEILAWD